MKTRSKKVRKVSKLFPATTFKAFLKQTLTDIFNAAFDADICGFVTEEDLASEARLCVSTVNRLRRGLTKEPRLSTVFKLCRAVKMDLAIVKEGIADSR